MALDLNDDLKKLAVEFLRECAQGRARLAFKERATPGFKHHNVWFPGDAQALAQGMDANHENFPNKTFETKRVIREGEVVAVHSKMTLQPGVEISVVHILRFEGDKLAELWDLPLQIPEESPNQFGAF